MSKRSPTVSVPWPGKRKQRLRQRLFLTEPFVCEEFQALSMEAQHEAAVNDLAVLDQ